MARRPPNARSPIGDNILCTVNSMESADKSKPEPINMMIDASVNAEKKIVYKFQDKYEVAVPLVVCDKPGEYYWSPGYTNILTQSGTLELSQKEREEQEGEYVAVKTTHSQFPVSMSPISSEMNKKARTEEGLAYIFANWEMYSDKLVKAYGVVGFKQREKLFALLHLTVNLSKHKMKQEVEELKRDLDEVKVEVKNKYGEKESTIKGATNIFARFFGVEPWKTSIDSLKLATFDITAETTPAKLGSFLVSVQNGDYDTPSIHLNLGAVSRPTMDPVMERLSNWFAVGNCEIYELKIEIPTDIDPSEYPKLHQVVDKLFQNLTQVEIELFTLTGTENVFMDSIAGTEKLATKVLKYLATSQKLMARQSSEESSSASAQSDVAYLACSGLQRLNVSDCWIDFDTIAALKDVISKSSISALRLSNLKFGLRPNTLLKPPDQVVMKMRNANCSDVQNRCLQCRFSFPCMFCFFPFCCCCNQLPDYAETKKDLLSKVDDFENQYDKFIKGQVDEYNKRVDEGFNLLKSAIQCMKKNAIGGIDIIDFEGTSLPELCGTAKRVNELLKVVAQQQPTAINFKKCGLCDVHVSGICDVFFQNMLLTHFEISVCSSSTEGLENLQSLAQNSPMLVSGKVHFGSQVKVRVASKELNADEKQEKSCCSLMTWSTITWEQKFQTVLLPIKKLSDADFKVYENKIEDEIKEHSVFPMYKTLNVLWCNNHKKLKNLERASKSEMYKGILSYKADEPKEKLIMDFWIMAGLKSLTLDEVLQQLMSETKGSGDKVMTMVTKSQEKIIIEEGKMKKEETEEEGKFTSLVAESLLPGQILP